MIPLWSVYYYLYHNYIIFIFPDPIKNHTQSFMLNAHQSPLNNSNKKTSYWLIIKHFSFFFNICELIFMFLLSNWWNVFSIMKNHWHNKIYIMMFVKNIYIFYFKCNSGNLYRPFQWRYESLLLLALKKLKCFLNEKANE